MAVSDREIYQKYHFKKQILVDGVTEDTNYEAHAVLNGVTFYTGDGANTPNGNLTGTAGDFLINGDGSSLPYYCTGGTNWTPLGGGGSDFTGSQVLADSGCFDINDIAFDLVTYAELSAYSSVLAKNTASTSNLATNNQVAAYFFQTRSGSGEEHYAAIALQDTRFPLGTRDALRFLMSDKTNKTTMYTLLKIDQTNNFVEGTDTTWGSVEVEDKAYITAHWTPAGTANNCERFGYRTDSGNQGSIFGYEAKGSTNSTNMGYQTGSTSTTNTTSYGHSITSANEGVEVGRGITGGQFCITIGALASNSGRFRNILVGYSASAGGSDCIGLGYDVNVSSNNTMVVGSSGASTVGNINNFWIGSGETCTAGQATTAVTFYTSEGTGTNIGGKDMLFRPGASTGTGDPGLWAVETAIASGSSSATLNSYTRKLEMAGDGVLVMTNQAVVSTNFKKMQEWGGLNIYISTNGTSPDTNLSETSASWCFDATNAGNIWYWTSGSSWTAK
jgi:hypothetical protein